MKCKICGTEFDSKFCPECGTPAKREEIKAKEPIFKKWWFGLIIVFVTIGVIGSLGKDSEPSSNTKKANSSVSSTNNNTDNTNSSKVEVTVVDFSSMEQSAIQDWATANNVNCKFEEDYSDCVAKGSLITQSTNSNDIVYEGDTIKIIYSLGKEPSTEFKNALKKAESYSNLMQMSKQGVYDQLTSEYGEQFPADAAQYGIDNVKADWNANALAKAKSYQNTMSMSKKSIYDQLVSDYGEKFTAEQAQYAIDHLDD